MHIAAEAAVLDTSADIKLKLNVQWPAVAKQLMSGFLPYLSPPRYTALELECFRQTAAAAPSLPTGAGRLTCCL